MASYIILILYLLKFNLLYLLYLHADLYGVGVVDHHRRRDVARRDDRA